MSENVIQMAARRRPTWSWADRVRKVRKDLRMTQAQFAELTGYGDKRIAAWEAGRNRPNDVESIAVRLEETTGVDRLWWIGWVDGDQPTPPPSDVEPLVGFEPTTFRLQGRGLAVCGLRPQDLREAA